jgi:hypothetical protein
MTPATGYDRLMNATKEPGEPRRSMPLMPEIAIVTTLALIAAPILLVAGTLALAAKTRLERRGPAQQTARR